MKAVNLKDGLTDENEVSEADIAPRLLESLPQREEDDDRLFIIQALGLLRRPTPSRCSAGATRKKTRTVAGQR